MIDIVVPPLPNSDNLSFFRILIVRHLDHNWLISFLRCCRNRSNIHRVVVDEHGGRMHSRFVSRQHHSRHNWRTRTRCLATTSGRRQWRTGSPNSFYSRVWSSVWPQSLQYLVGVQVYSLPSILRPPGCQFKAGWRTWVKWRFLQTKRPKHALRHWDLVSSICNMPCHWGAV